MAPSTTRAIVALLPQAATLSLLCAALLALVHPLTWRPWLAGWVPLLYLSLFWFIARYRRSSTRGKRLGRFLSLCTFSVLASATLVHHAHLAEPGMAWVGDRALSTPYSLTEIAATVLIGCTVVLLWMHWMLSPALRTPAQPRPTALPWVHDDEPVEALLSTPAPSGSDARALGTQDHGTRDRPTDHAATRMSNP